MPYALQNCTDDVATVEKGEGDQEQVEGVAQIAASQNHTEDDVSCLKRQSIFHTFYETFTLWIFLSEAACLSFKCSLNVFYSKCFSARKHVQAILIVQLVLH